MSKNDKSAAFFQIPKILHEDKNIKAQHIYIFMILYDQLRQREFWNKSNKWICEQTKIGASQVKEYLNELEELGYLYRIGMGLNRKFSLGRKLSNRPESIPDESKIINRPESVPVSISNRPESGALLAGIGTCNRPESGLHSNNLFKNIIKNISPPIKTPLKPKGQHPPPTQEYQLLMDNLDLGLLINPLEIELANHLKRRYALKEAN